MDFLQIIGSIVAAWCLGFTGGYLLTTFKRATEAI